MKTLVIYDSTFGNTKTIAQTIAKEMGEESRAVYVKDYIDLDLLGVELLIVGSPIMAWMPSEGTNKFLRDLQPNQLKGIKAAAFDTRVKLFIHGDAANKISQRLKELGAEIVIKPGMFYVKGKEGPLFGNEEEKAVDWAKTILSKL